MKIKSGKGKARKEKLFSFSELPFFLRDKQQTLQKCFMWSYTKRHGGREGVTVSIVGFFCSESMKNVFNMERACYSNGTLQASAQAIGIIKAGANANPTHERVIILLAAVLKGSAFQESIIWSRMLKLFVFNVCSIIFFSKHCWLFLVAKRILRYACRFARCKHFRSGGASGGGFFRQMLGFTCFHQERELEILSISMLLCGQISWLI